ncbi:hypothetical protein J3F83DRAFT_715568 [Trichoderma novae-zelandiae]
MRLHHLPLHILHPLPQPARAKREPGAHPRPQDPLDDHCRPEFGLTAAAGQLAAARDSVKAFHALGHASWTYIQFPTTSDEEPLDKSNKDTVANLITCFQMGYLIIQCIARGV